MDLVVVAGIVITILTGIPVLRQLRSHPKGLFILFFAEMWERFSFYGMRGLLIFYLTQHFLFEQDHAQGQYGAYNSLVYLMPLIGGILADRFIGTRKAIAFGAMLLVAGHLTMGFHGPAATQTLTVNGATYEFNVAGRAGDREVKLKVGDGLYDYGPAEGGGIEIKGLPPGAPIPAVMPEGTYELEVVNNNPFYKNLLYVALALIIMGVGYLKPNISAIVGQLYKERDPRRDPGFTLYYYGINLGAFWAAILCGLLGQKVGWWAGFGAAALGMLAGLIVFMWGKPLLEGKGEPADPEKLKKPLIGPINTEWAIYLSTIPAVAAVMFLVQSEKAVTSLLSIGSILVLGYLLFFCFTKCTKVERERIFLALILIASSVVFWTLFEQAGSSLNLFAEQHTDLTLTANQDMTAAQTQSFNAGFILLFAPVFSFIWAFLGRRGKDPNPVLKFGLALMQVGLGFWVLVWGANYVDGAYHVPLIFLVLMYLLHTTGELCLSPVGLSQMTKLSVGAVVSTVMATWFLASAWAHMLAGFIAKLTAAETVAGQVLDPKSAFETYIREFGNIGMYSIILGVALIVLSPFLKKLAHGASDTGPIEEAPAIAEPEPRKG